MYSFWFYNKKTGTLLNTSYLEKKKSESNANWYSGILIEERVPSHWIRFTWRFDYDINLSIMNEQLYM